MSYKMTEVDGQRFVTVYENGEIYIVSNETHANLDDILDAARAGESVAELVDQGRHIERKFADVVVGRVAVRDGRVYFDDDPMDNAITKAIFRFLSEGEDVAPLVKFMENVMANPQEHSREQFYRWIEHHDFPISEDGCIVAFKGVGKDHKSIHSGRAFVDGVERNGQIPNEVGSVITMPRSEVQHDPHVACHTGLHAGTWSYASSFGSVVMHVKINPRDVVSVPNDCSSQKVRVCRYEVVGFAESDYAGARYRDPEDEFSPLEDDDEYEDDDWY